MIDSKLVKLYSILTKNERIWLKKWINSPIANSNKDIVQLFNVFETRNAISSVAFNKERIFKLIYSNQRYNDLKLRRLMSDATMVLEQFISFYAFKHDLFYQHSKMAYRLKETELKDFSNKYLIEAKSALEKDTCRDSNYFYNTAIIQFQQLQIASHQIEQEVQYLQDYQKNMQHYFILESLKIVCFAHAQKQVLDEEYQHYFLNTIIQLIEENKIKMHVSIKIYYLLYKLTILENEDVLKKIITLISNNKTLFTAEEFRDIYLLIINFCIKKLNTSNDTSYATYAFNLYLDGFEKEFLLISNKIDKVMYRNCIAMGVKSGNLNRTNQFVSKYEAIVLDADVDFINYCKAYLYVAQEKYDLASKLLITINLKDILLNLNAKFLLVKIYMETKEYYVLENHIKTFKQFLQRKVKIAYHKQIYKLMLKYTYKITQLQSASKKEKIILAEEIKSISIPDKDWFLEMIEKMK